MNISEFERNQSSMTYQAIQTAIKRYETLLEQYSYGDRQLIMEEADSRSVHLYREFLADLTSIKALFIAGR